MRFERFSRAVIVAAGLAAMSATSACYDSRWGEAKRTQQHNAAALAPSALRADTQDAPRQRRAMRVRFWITPEYSAQILDPKRQMKDTLDDVNRILAPTLGVQLTAQSFETWDRDGAGDDLNAMLAEITKKDSGDDVDWVVGLVGNLPRASRSFHDAGYGEILGKHIVVRAPNRLDELDMIEKSFDRLEPEERERLEKQLKRHRAATIMLHEIGHTLGAVHEVARESIMSPQYDRRESAFAPETVSIMRFALAPRVDSNARPGDMNAAIADLLLREDPGPWIPEERQRMLDRLQRANAAIASQAASPPSLSTLSLADNVQTAPSANAAASASSASSASAPLTLGPDLSDLSPADREAYAQTEKAMTVDSLAAIKAARALAKKNPKSLPVADLRCRIAMSMSLAYSVTREECDPLMKLSADPNLKRSR